MLMEELRDYARELVWPGFVDRDEAVETLTDWVRDDGVTPDDVAAVVHETWAARLAEQASWPAVTDADRLDAAFDALTAAGLVAEMDFTCCQTCGFAEIDESAVEYADKYGKRPHGFTFFHRQDADRLADEPAHLYLSFGAFEPPHDDEAVARQIATALEAAGLSVEWDGTVGQRIGVTGLYWRRRLLPA